MILLTFGMNPLKKKIAAAAIEKKLPPKKLVSTITYEPLARLHSDLVRKKIDMVIFVSLFLDIDWQSLRLRGPAINWWFFYYLLYYCMSYLRLSRTVKSIRLDFKI